MNKFIGNIWFGWPTWLKLTFVLVAVLLSIVVNTLGFLHFGWWWLLLAK